MKTVEIAGGGLAGLSLGIALRERGVPVVVREAGMYPRHRVCGEFINGVTEATLDHLGIRGIFSDALYHHKTRWWIGGDRVLESELDRPALGISRWEMDERLRVRFEKLGGDLRVKDRVARVPREGLVWAAGRLLEKESLWLGLKAHFTEVEVEGCLEMHIGEGGYVGLTPVHEGVNVCGLFQKRHEIGKDLFNAYLTGCCLAGLARRLKAGRMNEHSLTGVSGFALGPQRAEKDLCVLGDAERMIPPFTGNGMSMAFESAECALEPLMVWAGGVGSWDRCGRLIEEALERRFSRRVKLAMGLHRFLTTRWGRSGLSVAARTGVLPFRWLHQSLC